MNGLMFTASPSLTRLIQRSENVSDCLSEYEHEYREAEYEYDAERPFQS